MEKLSNKIDAMNRTVSEVLSEKKYTVDYFQREFNWEAKHIEQLITDLTSAFLREYTPGDSREKGEKYNSYYLGPFVISEQESTRIIIDGQQRLTSLTLLLMYLNNLQKKYGFKENIKPLFLSDYRGQESFNIQVDERIECMDQLYKCGEYHTREGDDPSAINMAERYIDIVQAFPEEEIKEDNLLSFIDWIKYNVILVEIVAYSNDNAYTIFETMNDRGLNLTPTEMLKGFVLSRFQDSTKRQRANETWKKAVQGVQSYDRDEDQRFFQAWLRGQYAETIRQAREGSQNEDFERIGTRFHSWVRGNLAKMELYEERPDSFKEFVNVRLKFFLKAYLKILDSNSTLSRQLEHVHYIHQWGIASSLSYPLLLAPLNVDDDDQLVDKKMNTVAKYIEAFVVRRSVNFRKFAASSIRYTMYSLVKKIRNKDLDELRNILTNSLADMEEKFDGMSPFRLHGQNRKFVKFLLSRITAFIEQNSGMNTTFETYYHSPNGKPFQIEHIWADKFDEHRDEFEQKTDFDEYRNRIGDLVLLPQGTNQSFKARPYCEKLKHYVKENLLVRSLCPLSYESGPNFQSMIQNLGLPFESHEQFKKGDIVKRQTLYQRICEVIWDDFNREY